MTIRLRFLSLGAGVQSTAIALMAAHGEIQPMPDCGIFADTQDEGVHTYRHLDWLCERLPFPVYRVSQGKLSQELFTGNDLARIPAFVKGGGLAKRQCTRNFKIRPIRREVRKLLGIGPRGYIAGGSVEQWIGISLDEFERVKPSGANFITNRHPLIELRMRRTDCERWLLDHGYPVPPKSSCVECAFQSNAQWRQRQEDPIDFAQACAIDAALRTPENIKRFRGELYLHSSYRPLADIDFSIRQGDLFANECEGVCGV